VVTKQNWCQQALHDVLDRVVHFESLRHCNAARGAELVVLQTEIGGGNTIRNVVTAAAVTQLGVTTFLIICVTPSDFRLGGNDLGPEGGIAIAEALKVNKTIKVIK
jgi:hypothetical protein